MTHANYTNNNNNNNINNSTLTPYYNEVYFEGSLNHMERHELTFAFTIERVPGDGDCSLHAILSNFDNNNTAQEIRDILVKKMYFYMK